MQVVGSNEPIENHEVSTDGGATWQGTTRQPYNFFENPSGFGTDAVDVRVTSSMGNVIVVKGVSVEADLQTPAGENF
jgi:expansin